jgi:hypothetical protein
LTVAAAAVARVFTFRRRRLETELVLAFLRVRRFDSPRPPVRKNLECAKSPTFRRPTQLIGSRDRRFVWRWDGGRLCTNAAERVGDLCARATTMSEEEEVPEKQGWFSRLATGLAKSVGEGLD